MKTTTNIIHRVVIAVCACTWLVLSPAAQAVTPAPDGGYPGGNTAEGQNALFSLTTGGYNTAVGFLSLKGTTTSSFNTAIGAGTLVLNNGDSNTAIGTAALFANRTGTGNTATGTFALLNNDVTGNHLGSYNSAFGAYALEGNTDGLSNSACGWGALTANTTGSNNTATGYVALYQNTTGSLNTANGNGALSANTVGHDNSATGADALFSNTTGNSNTADGDQALYNNTTGFDNTATGYQALFSNSMSPGSGNTGDGFRALYSNQTGLDNTAVGSVALGTTTGSRNTAIGAEAGQSANGDGNVFIGQGVDFVGSVSNQTYIRNINTTSVSGGNADYVTVDLTSGLLGHLSSSRRYKEDVKPMAQASEALYRLNPITYRYKKEIDRNQSTAFGLLAEDVAEVNPELVARDAQGQPESIHYEMVNAMLLNEFLKEHRAFVAGQRKVQEQETTITQLKNDFQSELAAQQKQIRVLYSGLEKVSAQLEVSRAQTAAVPSQTDQQIK